MKQNRGKQTGSAHVVVVVVVVVVLLGALGWVFWQNFMKEPEQASQQTDTSQTADNAEDTPATASEQEEAPAKEDATTEKKAKEKKSSPSGAAAPDSGYFAVKEWGVQFKYPSGASVKWRLDGPRLSFTSKAVEGLGGACATWGENPPSSGNLVRVTRTSTKEKREIVNVAYLGKVGYYYYYGTGAQSICSDKQTALQQRDRDALWASAKTIKALK